MDHISPMARHRIIEEQAGDAVSPVRRGTLIMKRILLATGVVAMMAGASHAGGVPEMLPDVIERETSSSAGGIIVPLLLLLLVVALVTSSDGGTQTIDQ